MGFEWARDEFDENGKLVLLYRQQRIIDERIINPGMRVIDVGGWGKIAHRLAQEGCDVVLINPDKDFGADKKQPLPHKNLSIVIGDIRSSGFPDESFDAAHCSETLEHITDGRDVAIREIFRLLKPGGVFVGTIPMPGICHPADEPDIHFLKPDSLKELVKDYCDSVSVEPTGSIFKTDSHVSWFFVCYKRKGV